MNSKKIGIALLLGAAVLCVGCGPSGATFQEQRENVLKMESETLEKFYVQEPIVREKISKAAGYGVFSNGNVNLVLLSVGGGYGVVTDRASDKKTYMRMGMGGLGIGLGAKDYRVLLIFPERETLDKFVESGWEFGGHADAAAKAEDKGAEASGQGAIGDIETYSITEAGLALQATVAGTKYWKDKDLNDY